MDKALRNIYQFLITLLSIICLTVASEIVILKVFTLSSTHWLKAAQTSNYTVDLTSSINQSIQDLGSASGIKPEGLQNIISQEQVDKDFNQFLTHSFNGEAYSIKQEVIKNSLSKAVTSYAEKENLPINETNQESVTQFVDQAYQAYDSGIRNQIISVIGIRVGLLDKISSTMLKAIGILAMALIFLFILIYWIGNRYTHVFTRNLGQLFSSTSLFLFFISGMVLINQPVKAISVLDGSLKNWLEAGLRLPIILNILLGCFYLLMGVLFSVYSYKEYRKLEQRGFRRIM